MLRDNILMQENRSFTGRMMMGAFEIIPFRMTVRCDCLRTALIKQNACVCSLKMTIITLAQKAFYYSLLSYRHPEALP